MKPARPHTLVRLVALAFWLGVAAAAPAQTGQSMSLDVLGDDMDLQVGKGGSIRWLADMETGELNKMIARKAVRLRSDKLDLDCDELTYSKGENLILALGDPVQIKQGAIQASARNFSYYPDEGKAVLTGDPIVRQKTGQVSGEKITIIQRNGALEVLVDAGSQGGQVSNTDAAPTPATQPSPRHREPQPRSAEIVIDAAESQNPDEKKNDTPRERPTRIDAGTMDKIPELSVDEETP